VTADCLKLTSYFGERHRSGGRFVADALIELYGRHQIAASILLRGTEGFGLKHHLRTDRSLTLSEDLPLIAIAVDTRPRIETVLTRTIELNRTGLVTLERARLLAGAAEVAGPGSRPDDLQETTKLTVYLGRQERVDRVPAFIAGCVIASLMWFIIAATGLALLAGVAMVRLLEMANVQKAAAAALAILLLWFAGSSVLSHPDYLPYFNELAGSHPGGLAKSCECGARYRRAGGVDPRNHRSRRGRLRATLVRLRRRRWRSAEYSRILGRREGSVQSQARSFHVNLWNTERPREYSIRAW